MKKRFVCSISVLLLFCMILLSVVSCKPNVSNPPVPTSEENSGDHITPALPDEEPVNLNLIADGKSDYVIVRSLGAETWEKDLAVLFQQTLKGLTGIELPISDDFENEAAGEKRGRKEIIIGQTNREDEYTPDYESVGDGYHLFVSKQRLVFASKSETGLFFAIRNFFLNIYGLDITADVPEKLDYVDLTVPADFLAMDSFPCGYIPYMQTALSDYSVIYDKNDYLSKRAAISVASAIRQTTGVSLKTEATATPDATSIVISNTNEDGTKLSSGKWKLDVAKETIYIRASDYNGMAGATDYLKKAMENGHYNFGDKFSVGGDFKDGLNSLDASNAYAYNKLGNVRIMFYNLLWLNHTSSTSGNDIPAAERNALQAAMLSQYRPDVIGCQEVDTSKRTGAGDNNIVTLFENLGYAESLDPAVSGNGVNCTPLFYNTATTELIQSEYYQYQAQDAGASDFDKASKSLTWALFKIKSSGEKYIVISTHMCTRDDNVRKKQAEELLVLVGSLKAHNCPIFLGGDFNGRSEAQNYICLTENGFEDVQKTAEFTTDTCTHKNYPKYNETLGIMEANGTAVQNPDSIDHILLMSDASLAKVRVFGVVVDDCTLSASDHLPIFADAVISAVDDELAGAEWSGRY